ncbi:hypothetical protein IAU60_000034 [Kwoniella sp. DSM 27419]
MFAKITLATFAAFLLASVGLAQEGVVQMTIPDGVPQGSFGDVWGVKCGSYKERMAPATDCSGRSQDDGHTARVTCQCKYPDGHYQDVAQAVVDHWAELPSQ